MFFIIVVLNNDWATKIMVLNRIKKHVFLNSTQTISYAVYLSFAITIVALAPVAKFHSFEASSIPVSLKTLKPAVLGPEVPWFKAKIVILLMPFSSGILNF